MKKLFENWRTSLNEVEYEPGRAVADVEKSIDTSEERPSPEHLEREEMLGLADKFKVGIEFDIPDFRDGKSYAIVTLQNGETMYYYDSEEMYQDLAKRHEMNEELRDYSRGQSSSPEIQIPGYGILTVKQVERKLAQMLQEAAEDAMKDPPHYSHLNNGVIQALHKALKDFKEL
jgi:hypothetical protein